MNSSISCWISIDSFFLSFIKNTFVNCRKTNRDPEHKMCQKKQTPIQTKLLNQIQEHERDFILFLDQEAGLEAGLSLVILDLDQGHIRGIGGALILDLVLDLQEGEALIDEDGKIILYFLNSFTWIQEEEEEKSLCLHFLHCLILMLSFKKKTRYMK